VPEQTPDVGGFIREQRRLAELSVRRLAEMSGVSNPYLSQIERGLRRPSADILANIAKGLQISAESLYVRAGILDGDADTARGSTDLESAIRHASELTPDQRKAMLGVYRSFVGSRSSSPDPQRSPVSDDDSDPLRG
jgi:transcriptional regulator with XRE-family HTH domain